MGFKEDISAMKDSVQADLDALTQKQTELQANLTALDALSGEYDTDVAAADAAGFQKGLAQAGQANGSDKIYSEAEMQARVQPLNDQITTLTTQMSDATAKLSDLQAQVDGQAGAIQSAIDSAVSSIKAGFVQDMQTLEVQDQAIISKYTPAPAPVPVTPLAGKKGHH